MNTSLRLVPLVIVGSALFLGGCAKSKDEYPVKGRVGTGVTTDYEAADARVQPTALSEFADQAAQQIAQDLVDIKDFTALTERVTIVLGDINNKTDIVRSDEFEYVRSRIRNSLLTSKLIRREARFIESRARMNALIRSETGHTDKAVPKVDLAKSAVLNMDVYRIGRSGTNLYYMEVQLVRLSDGEILFSNRYEVKQVQ